MNFDKIKEVIADTVSIDEAEITLDADLKEDLGIDSLDAVEISIALEEAFDISIPQEELAKFVTVQDIVDFVDAQNA
ncbi:MAG: acyl carrier protein [Clostridiales bacterium]|nr:acyl carrier protein [Clostridiales bacterium]